jgi:DNA-binding CsgD family transcriptional regulator
MRGYLKDLLGLSLFLAWVSCVFYSNIVWDVTQIGFLKEFPMVLSMFVSGIIGLAVIAVLDNRKLTDWRWPTWIPLSAAAICIMGTLLMLGWLKMGSGEDGSIAVGAVVTSFGFSTFVLLWGSQVSRLNSAEIEFVAPVSFVCAHTIFFVVSLLPIVAARLVVISLPLAAAVAFRHSTISAGIRQTATIAPSGNVAKEDGWLTTLLILILLRFWYGAIRAINSSTALDASLQSAISFLLSVTVFSVFIFSALRYARAISVPLAVSWSIPLMLIALVTVVFLHMDSMGGALLVQATNMVMSLCLQAFFYILFAKAARQVEGRGVFFFACYLAGIALGMSSGIVFGSWLDNSFSKDETVLGVSVLAAVIASSLMLLVPKAASLGTTAAIFNRDRVMDSPYDSLIRDKTKQLAEKYRLSPREEEILSYLLMGRNRPYIRDTLYISINTVNTHIKSIYIKIGINSQQELIDLAHE